MANAGVADSDAWHGRNFGCEKKAKKELSEWDGIKRGIERSRVSWIHASTRGAMQLQVAYTRAVGARRNARRKLHAMSHPVRSPIA